MTDDILLKLHHMRQRSDEIAKEAMTILRERDNAVDELELRREWMRNVEELLRDLRAWLPVTGEPGRAFQRGRFAEFFEFVLRLFQRRAEVGPDLRIGTVRLDLRLELLFVRFPRPAIGRMRVERFAQLQTRGIE